MSNSAFNIYFVGKQAGIQFMDGSVVVVAGRHPTSVTEALIGSMNLVYQACPKAHYRNIRKFVNDNFDFDSAYPN